MKKSVFGAIAFALAVGAATPVIAGEANPAGDPAAANAEGGQIASYPVTYRTVEVDGVDIFVREAGAKDAPVVLLLHGFPSSSHMFRDLIPQLAGSARVIAPDYPGFGYSAAPDAGEFEYDFARVAALIDGLTQKLGADRYVIYMQDFGGPVGMRLALSHPERVEGIVVQNATFHAQGWNPEIVGQFAPFWQNRNAETEAPLRGFLAAETTRWQYVQGSARAERLSPDAWAHDQAGLDRPGNQAVMLEYLFNYQDNVGQYPEWQAWLGEAKPPALIVWGKNDPFFTLGGVEALNALLPNAEVHLYDAGHFALETHGTEIAAEIREFLTTLPE